MLAAVRNGGLRCSESTRPLCGDLTGSEWEPCLAAEADAEDVDFRRQHNLVHDDASGQHRHCLGQRPGCSRRHLDRYLDPPYQH